MPAPVNMPSAASHGISIVICCHNSAARLPQTLRHLAAQESPGAPWEVVLVDNASTDDTRAAALLCWPVEHPVQLRVVSEPRPGLVHARERGFLEARHELVSFVDDDNWLAPGWIARVAEIFTAHPEVGAAGGLIDAVSDSPLPDWFETAKLLYAISHPEWPQGDITETRRTLCGAGITIRKKVWEQLKQSDVKLLLSGRKGSQLTSGEDSELCLAIRLLGWRLWFDHALRILHYMPEGRLQWSYARRLYRGSGASTVYLDPYWFVLRKGKGLRSRLSSTWIWQFTRSVVDLSRRAAVLTRALRSNCEGDYQVLELEAAIGRAAALIADPIGYEKRKGMVATVDWSR